MNLDTCRKLGWVSHRSDYTEVLKILTAIQYESSC